MRSTAIRLTFLFAAAAAAVGIGAACLGDPPPVAFRPEAGPTDALVVDAPIDGTLPAHCTDGAKNGDETDVDCGGSCATCSNGQACTRALDCASGACTAARCGPWAKVFASAAGDDIAYGVAFAPDGSFVVVGSAVGTIDFGNGSVAAIGIRDAFVAKYLRSGELVWAKRYGAGGGQTEAYSVAIAPNGDIAVVGHYSVAFAVDGLFLPAPDSFDGFVILLAAGGQHVRFKRIGGDRSDAIGGVAFDPQGDLFVGGGFTSTSVTIDALPAITNREPGSDDFFVTKLRRSDLVAQWLVGFGSTGDAGTPDYLGGLTAVGGDVAVGCQYFGGDGLALGGPVLPNAGYWDLGIARLHGADGGHVWSRHLGAPGFNDLAAGLAADPAGNVYFGGTIEGNVDLGGGGHGPGMKPFVAKYGPDGGYLWSRVGALPGADPGTQNAATRVAVDRQGGAILAGTFHASALDFGLAPPVADPPDSGAPDPFIAVYDPSGVATFARSFFMTGLNTYGTYIPTVDPATGNVLLVGQTAQAHDFGSGLVGTTSDAAPGSYDFFIASLGRLP
jgi:hypothetical protein